MEKWKSFFVILLIKCDRVFGNLTESTETLETSYTDFENVTVNEEMETTSEKYYYENSNVHQHINCDWNELNRTLDAFYNKMYNSFMTSDGKFDGTRSNVFQDDDVKNDDFWTKINDTEKLYLIIFGLTLLLVISLLINVIMCTRKSKNTAQSTQPLKLKVAKVQARKKSLTELKVTKPIEKRNSEPESTYLTMNAEKCGKKKLKSHT
jgi:hypothetical protein